MIQIKAGVLRVRSIGYMSTSATLAALPRETTVGNHFISNYPPFSQWQPEAIPDFLETLHRPVAKCSPMSLYLHVPFCRQRCHYCYFRVYPRRDDAEVAEYFSHVLKEFALYRDLPAVAGRPLHSIYFGGGTPSYPSVAQLRLVLETLRAGSNWERLEEFTFECEPGTVSPEKFALLKEFGVTRLSIGFQTLNNEVLRRSGRDLQVRDCLEAYEQARAAGFDQINLDLLAGLPGETEASWRRTIREASRLQPDCVTIYQLELTHNSGLYRAMQAGRDPHLSDWPTKRSWVRESFACLEQLGYTVASGYMAVRDPARWRFAYTVDHFWRGDDLLALGESSFGHFQGMHYQNAHTFDGYAGLLREDRLPLRRAYRMDAEEKWRREFILQMKTGSVDASYFRNKFHLDPRERLVPELQRLEAEGLLELQGDLVRLTRPGLLDVDWLLPIFYEARHRGTRYT